MPTPTQDPALDMLRDNAEWAKTFSGVDEQAPTTNLAQRHREAIANYQQAQDEQDATDFQNQVMHDHALQGYVFGKQHLEMQKAKHDFEMEKAAELAPVQIAAEAQLVKTRAAQEKHDTALALRDLQVQEHSALGHWELNQATDPTQKIDPAAQRQWVNSIGEKYPLALAHDPGFRERYNAVQQGFAAQDKAANEPGTEGLFDSPEDIWKQHPGATVSQSQTRKGKYYATNIPDPNKPGHLGAQKPSYEADIDQQIAQDAGKPFYYNSEGKAKKPTPDNAATHYEVEYRKSDGTFGQTQVSAARYQEIKNAANAQTKAAPPTPTEFASEAEVEAAAKAGTVKTGQTVVVGGRKAVWH